MASKADQELEKAKQLLRQATSSKNTTESHRAFFEQLISICSYPSYDCKSYFGTLVAKYFAEFEDLQDKAIDAILDLCEDDEERVRMIGIKGLGATGKADNRWIRGNVGVSLQLLECPPKELAAIHDQLFSFLNISPSDVFTVMIDDMRSNEDTGASRTNILDFLIGPAEPRLQQLFKSGEHTRAEEILYDGLEAVLSLLPSSSTGSASPADRRRLGVMSLMGGMSFVSGKKATTSSAKKYARLIGRSIKSNSSVEVTRPVIKLFSDYIGHEPPPPLQLEEKLGFVADHGRSAVEMTLMGSGNGGSESREAAGSLMDKLVGWAEEGGRVMRGSKDEDLAEDVIQVLLDGVTSYVRKERNPFTSGETSHLEMILYSMYHLFKVRDRRRDVVRSSDAKQLRELADKADKASKRAKHGSEILRLESIDRLASILEDYKRPLPSSYTPSWKMPPRQATRPTTSSGQERPTQSASIRTAGTHDKGGTGRAEKTQATSSRPIASNVPAGQSRAIDIEPATTAAAQRPSKPTLSSTSTTTAVVPTPSAPPPALTSRMDHTSGGPPPPDPTSVSGRPLSGQISQEAGEPSPGPSSAPAIRSLQSRLGSGTNGGTTTPDRPRTREVQPVAGRSSTDIRGRSQAGRELLPHLLASTSNPEDAATQSASASPGVANGMGAARGQLGNLVGGPAGPSGLSLSIKGGSALDPASSHSGGSTSTPTPADRPRSLAERIGSGGSSGAKRSRGDEGVSVAGIPGYNNDTESPAPYRSGCGSGSGTGPIGGSRSLLSRLGGGGGAGAGVGGDSSSALSTMANAFLSQSLVGANGNGDEGGDTRKPKRAKETTTITRPTTSTGRSLLSRLSSSGTIGGNSGNLDTNAPQPQSSSLTLTPMSTSGGTSTYGPGSGSGRGSGRGSELKIKRDLTEGASSQPSPQTLETASQSPAPQLRTINILARARASATASPTPPTVTDPPGSVFSIRNHAARSQSPSTVTATSAPLGPGPSQASTSTSTANRPVQELSIRSSSSSSNLHGATPNSSNVPININGDNDNDHDHDYDNEDYGPAQIRRKGRGFQKRDDEDDYGDGDIVMRPAVATAAATPAPPPRGHYEPSFTLPQRPRGANSQLMGGRDLQARIQGGLRRPNHRGRGARG